MFLRVFLSGEFAFMLIFQVLLSTVYVTEASTRPSMPSDELEASTKEKVMEVSDMSVTFQVR